MTLLIKRDQIIAGIPAIKLRSFFKRTEGLDIISIFRAFFDDSSLSLDESFSKSYKTILELKKLGYIEDWDQPQADDPKSLKIPENLAISTDQWNHLRVFNYRTTSLATQLAHARAGSPLKREKAWKSVKEFLSRCRELQRGSHTKYLWEVESAWLFGSLHNSDKPEVNDIDVAIIICATAYQTTPEGQLERESQIKAEVTDFFRGRSKVNPAMKFLRGGNSYFSFITDDSTIEGLLHKKQVPHRLLYSKSEGDLTIEVPDLRQPSQQFWYRAGYGDSLDNLPEYRESAKLLSQSSILKDPAKTDAILALAAYEQGWNNGKPAPSKLSHRRSKQKT